ncbi:MAG: MarR family transcriptional regulator [Verrucomicrobiales bacterium]|nr:MarR family transcriptional regulator [Verrucomicrobiales bacterium]
MPVDLQAAPGFLIDRNAHLIRLKVKRKIAELGLDLTNEEAAILAALNHHDGLRIGDLARILVRDTTTVTRQVEGLERKKCVFREAAAEDRRAVQVKLLREGIRRYQLFDPPLQKLKAEVFSGISEREEKILIKCLQKVKANLLND